MYFKAFNLGDSLILRFFKYKISREGNPEAALNPISSQKLKDQGAIPRVYRIGCDQNIPRFSCLSLDQIFGKFSFQEDNNPGVSEVLFLFNSF